MASSQDEDSSSIPVELRPLLAVVACIDAPVSEVTLACALAGSPVADELDAATRQGILVTVNDNTTLDPRQQKLYLFSSDETKSASLPAEKLEQEELHLKIGKQVLRSGLDDRLALSQLRKAESLLLLRSSCNNAYYQIIEACLQTGTSFAQSKDFKSASDTLNFGVRLISRCDCRWKAKYDLSLSLYQASVEANHGNSNFEEANAAIREVRSKARDILDTVTVSSSKMMILGVTGRQGDACKEGLKLLRRLGSPLPQHPNKVQRTLAFTMVKRQLRSKTTGSICRMPMMTNDRVIAIMKILNLVQSVSISEPGLLHLITARMINLTLEHGLSGISAPAFGSLAMLLCAEGDSKQALRYAKVALELYDLCSSREWLPRTFLPVYGGVLAHLESPENSLEPLLQAYQVGLDTGDTEFAFLSAYLRVSTMFSLGHPLRAIEHEALECFEEATKRKHALYEKWFAMYLQFLQNLRKSTRNPIILVGEYFDEDVMYTKIVMSQDLTIQGVHMFKAILAFVFRDYLTALRESKLAPSLEKDTPTRSMLFCLISSVRALSLLAICRETGLGRRSTVQEVMSVVRYLRKRSKGEPEFFSSKVSLIEAELAWLQGYNAVAQNKYWDAIASSVGIYFDNALAHENFCRFVAETGDGEAASFHLEESLKAYRECGAFGKADHLEHELKRFVSAPLDVELTEG